MDSIEANFFAYVLLWLKAFVRSGNVNLNDGRMYNVGERGYGWSRATRSSTVAYNLWMTPTGVNPSDYNNRWNGFSLR